MCGERSADRLPFQRIGDRRAADCVSLDAPAECLAIEPPGSISCILRAGSLNQLPPKQQRPPLRRGTERVIDGLLYVAAVLDAPPRAQSAVVSRYVHIAAEDAKNVLRKLTDSVFGDSGHRTK